MANTYLTRNMTTQGSSIKGTFSAWIKNSQGGNYDCGFLSHYHSSNYFFDIVQQDGSIEVADYRSNAGGYILRKRTTAKYRDPNGWFHLYVAIDRSLGTAEDRCKIYVNGNRVTDFQSSENANYSQQTSGGHTGTVSMNNDYTARVGIRYSGQTLNGSMSHVYWIDGSVIDIAQFGSTDSTTGEWKINTSPTIASYGTNGFLILKDANTITDQSGGSYDFSSNGAGVTKTEDCPSNVFATGNPLIKGTNGNSYGNLRTTSGQNSWESMWSTLGASSGKFYAEFKRNSSGYTMFGVRKTENITTFDEITGATGGIGWQSHGSIYNNNSETESGGSPYSTYADGDIIGVAMDLDNSKLYFHKNGTYQNSGVPTSGSTGTGAISLTANAIYHFGFCAYNGSCDANFGNGYFATTAVSSAGTNASGIGIFEYDVPTGYTALSTKGLNL